MLTKWEFNALADLHWRMPGARPPKGLDSFVLTYKIFGSPRPLRGPHPLWEILDPPLQWET